MPPPGAGWATIGAVGFNPYERFRARPFDYALVLVCAAVVVALLIWALAG